jgi:hypothetical protein
MMTDRDDELDRLFAAARRASPRPSADLMGRIAVDAERHLPGSAWRRLWAAVGGWPAAAGFAAAALAGVWIGAARPEPVEAVIGIQGYDTADLMPGFGAGWDDAG